MYLFKLWEESRVPGANSQRNCANSTQKFEPDDSQLSIEKHHFISGTEKEGCIAPPKNIQIIEIKTNYLARALFVGNLVSTLNTRDPWKIFKVLL